MDELTRSAIASARDGRWELLDAMELLARSKDDFTVVCLVHRVGSLAMIGHCEIEDERGVKASKITCTFCDGDGEVEVEGRDGRWRDVECPVCDGDGTVERGDPELVWLDRGAVTCWRHLDGSLVEANIEKFSCQAMTIEMARRVVSDAKKALADAKESTP